MKDFFRFRSELLEGKKEQKHKDKSKELTELDKDEDDPCWDGYVQLGTKMKNGKEVPNCVPIEEARKQMKNESVLNEGSADTKRFMKQIVRAFKPISRKEKIAKTFSYKPGKDYASVPVIITYNKSEDEYASYIWSPRLKDMLHHDFYGDLDDAVDDAKFEIKDDIDRGGEFVPGRQRLRMGESALNERVEIKRSSTDNKNVSKREVTYDVYVNGKFDRHFKDIIDAEKYAKKKDPSFKLNEGTEVEVSVRDARKANDIASDMYEETLTESVKVRHDRCKRTHGKNASGRGTWLFTTKSSGDPSSNEIYMGKSGQTVKDAAKDAAKALGSDEVYVMESAASLSEQALTESKTVEVTLRDARKANDIAQDMFRGEYKTDGSNTFVFKKSDAADDFRAELEKQRIELLEETKPKSGDREAYKKFFNKALKKFGADSLADLDDDKQKEFFNYVDKNWESEDEKTVTEATAEITRFGSDKEKSDVMSLAKKMGLKVKDTGDGIELSGNMKKISDVTTTAQKRGAKIEESRRISSRDDAHKEIEKMMGRGREVQEVGEYVYMTLKMGGRIDIEKMKRSAAKMKRNAPEIIDTMISMGLIETIGGKIVNIHPQYHVHEST